MKEIKVLGPGCPKCIELFDRTKQVAEKLELKCNIEKISDMVEIASYGVMMTPALVVNGEILVMGKVPSDDELKSMLETTKN